MPIYRHTHIYIIEKNIKNLSKSYLDKKKNKVVTWLSRLSLTGSRESNTLFCLSWAPAFKCAYQYNMCVRAHAQTQADTHTQHTTYKRKSLKQLPWKEKLCHLFWSLVLTNPLTLSGTPLMLQRQWDHLKGCRLTMFQDFNLPFTGQKQ